MNQRCMSEFTHGKIQSSLHRAVQQVIARGLQDPRLDGTMVTITELELAPDGRDATVHVSVLPEKAEKRAIAAIAHARAFIRREAGELIRMKMLPQLHFSLDRRLKHQAGVIRALAQGANVVDDGAPPEGGTPPSTPPAGG
jgi:ribosome-binding factor A